MTPNAVGNLAGSTGQMPITQALYGKKPRRKPKPSPAKRGPSRHSFAVADQLPPETRQKLAALQGKLERQAKPKRRRPARKATP